MCARCTARWFEIAFHGATMETSRRERTVQALERLECTFGAPPRVHANHSFNRENLYWGAGRLDDPALRLLYGTVFRHAAEQYEGHRPGSPYWWGDPGRCPSYCTAACRKTVP